MNKVPILVLAFNRADHVLEAMKAIREYKPDRLYLECDGPREGKKDEDIQVNATRRSMLEAVDWPCEVKTLFREQNMGCAHAVNDAITWFFKNEEYGIIIEDDIVVGPDFFRLCEVLLPRYQDEDRVMQIASQNYSGRKDIANSYVYSHRIHCWGWATWARAWKKMDMSMSAAPNLSYREMIVKLGFFRGVRMRYQIKYAYNHINVLTSWAIRWYLSIIANGGLILYPGVNLAINIGMDRGAHYSKLDIDPYAGLEIGNIEWPLEYNDSFIPDKKQRYFDNKDYIWERWCGIKKRLRLLFYQCKQRFVVGNNH